MVVYLPIFALTGVEGRMFHPMALTVVLALLGAMILSVTFVPAAVALFMGNKVAEKENRLMSWAKRRYEPLLDMALRRTPRVLIAATVFMVACGVLASRMGSEFIPSLNEGDMAIQALRIPGTSLSQSLEMQKQLEVRLKEKFPEIERIFARTGTAEIASDPMPPNISDGYIMLKPMDQWPKPRKTHAELLAAIQEEAGKMPGNNYEFSQPIQLRFNELISGVRSDVAVKIFGDDNDVLNRTAAEVAESLNKIPGASEVKVEQTTGLPVLTVNIDRARAALRAESGRRAGHAGDRRGRARGRRITRATGASTSWCGCRNRCARAFPPCASCPSPCPRLTGRRRRPTSRCPRSPAWTCRPAPTRSRARTASAAS